MDAAVGKDNNNKKIKLKVDLTPRQRDVLVAGGLLNYIRSTQQQQRS